MHSPQKDGSVFEGPEAAPEISVHSVHDRLKPSSNRLSRLCLGKLPESKKVYRTWAVGSVHTCYSSDCELEVWL